MIKRIFFDLDETLLHTMLHQPDQPCVVHQDEDDDSMMYYTIFHPQRKEVLAFARNLVSPENVYVLTASVREYAQRVNLLGGLGFTNDHIFAREDLRVHSYSSGWGGVAHCKCAELADPNNVLIDNLPPRYNEEKIAFIGMKYSDIPERYIKVRDYYGVNFPNDKFASSVIEQLQKL